MGVKTGGRSREIFDIWDDRGMGAGVKWEHLGIQWLREGTPGRAEGIDKATSQPIP